MTYDNTPTQAIDVNGTSLAYREAGQKGGVPLVLLHHLTAVLDDWDPAVVDGLASSHHVIAFDNRGVGRSGGTTPSSVGAMAKDAIAFIRALGLDQVDLLGFSLGGFVAQVVAQEQPELVRKLIIAGSGPAGGEGISNMGAVLQDAVARAAAAGKHPKHFLFFSQTDNGQAAANAFLARLGKRTEDRDAAISNASIHAQLTAIHAWGQAAPAQLSGMVHPVLVVNGDDDVMAPTINSFELVRRLPNAQLSIFLTPVTAASFSTTLRSFSRPWISFADVPASPPRALKKMAALGSPFSFPCPHKDGFVSTRCDVGGLHR